METITTRAIGKGFAETKEIVLTETPQIITAFRPQIHEGGVRGIIVRYKKDRDGNRQKPDSVDFRQLKSGEGIEIELKTEAVSKLIQSVQQLQTLIEETGVPLGIHQYKVADVDELVISDRNKAQIIQKLLDANHGVDIWKQLADNDPDLSTRLAMSRLQENRTTILNKFEKMLKEDALTEQSWQNFFEENTWIFGYGLRYHFLRVIQNQPNYGGDSVNGRGGQRGDFLTTTEAATKFSCLVEIKKPSTKLLQKDQYRNGAWGISADLAGAISQMQVNCAQWEIYGSKTEQNRERLNGVNTISPRGIVVIGKTSDLNTHDKKNSFERFRREIRNPEIITYDELYERARFIVQGDTIDVGQIEEEIPF